MHIRFIPHFFKVSYQMLRSRDTSHAIHLLVHTQIHSLFFLVIFLHFFVSCTLVCSAHGRHGQSRKEGGPRNISSSGCNSYNYHVFFKTPALTGQPSHLWPSPVDIPSMTSASTNGHSLWTLPPPFLSLFTNVLSALCNF